MSDLMRMIRRVRRRSALEQALRGAGAGVLAGCAVGLLAVVIDRLVRADLPLLVFLLPPLAGGLAGAAVALRRPPSLLAAATIIDRRFRLADRVGTACAIARGRTRGDAAFHPMIARDAEHRLRGLDVRQAVPIRPGRLWGGAAGLVAALVAAAVLLPHRGDAAPSPEPDAGAEEFETDRLAEATIIDETVQQTRDDTLDEAAREELRALEELSRQLRDPESAPLERERARDESAARLDDLAQRMLEEAEREEAELDELADAFDSLPEREIPPDASSFREALARGDYGAAAEALERLLEESESMSPEERRRLADELRRWSEAIDPPVEAPAEGADATPPTEPEAPQGDEERDAEPLSDESEAERNPPSDAVREALEEAADRIDPEEQGEQQQQGEATQQGEQQQQGEATEQGEQQQQGEATQQGEQQQQGEATEQGEQQQQGDATQQGEQQQQGDATQQGEQQQQGDATQQGEQQQQGDATQQGEQQQQGDATQQGEQQQQGDATQQGEQQQQGDATEQGEQQQGEATEQGEQQQGEATEQGEQQQQGEATEQGEQQQGEATEQGEQQQGAATEQGEQQQGEATEQGEGEPSDRLRELEERRRGAQERREAAERMRRAARRLAERGSEAERDRWDPGAGAGEPSPDAGTAPAPIDEREQGLEPGTIDELDLTDETVGDRTIAELLDEQPDDGATTGTGATDDRRWVRSARRAAERAVERSTVPSRYHETIKRYFDRLGETARKASPASPSPDEAR